MSPPNSSSKRSASRARAAKRVAAAHARDEGPTTQDDEPLEPSLDDPQLEAEDLLDALPQAQPEVEAEPQPRGWDEADAAAREQLRNGLQERLSAYLTRGRARVVLTDNLYSMVTIKRGDDVWTFRVHHMFAQAPPSVVRALARYAQKQTREASGIVRAYIDSNDAKVRRRSSPRPITLDVQGRHHNLQEMFDRLNAEYFDDAIEARITWGPRTKRKRSRDSIKLGSYTVEDGLIRIHPVLDAADVPAFFVEWIVYHEMLHEVHDMPVIDGRRVYHTAEFRRAEAQFERYAEAVMWERTHLAKLLER